MKIKFSIFNVFFVWIVVLIISSIGIFFVENSDDQFLKNVSRICVKFSILLYVLYAIKKNNYNTLFKFKVYFPGLFVLIIPVIFIIFQLKAKYTFSIFLELEFVLFIVFSILVGYSEEYLFRGLINMKLFDIRKNIYAIAIGNSMFFALSHYVNLFSNFQNFQGVSTQVLFAFAFGLLFNAVFFRTLNIHLTAILHALINISIASPELFLKHFEAKNFQNNESSGMNSATIFILLFIIGGAFLSLFIFSKSKMFLKFEKQQ